jgi:hypothetical protein
MPHSEECTYATYNTNVYSPYPEYEQPYSYNSQFNVSDYSNNFELSLHDQNSYTKQ